MGDAVFERALDLFRRLPPSTVENDMVNALNLVPDLMEDLLSAVDQPLKVLTCPETSKPFIVCDYNRDGESYRSPWSNAYTPPMDDGITPPDELRKLEISANEVFNKYREVYYEAGSVSSCYFWEVDGGFACCVAINKSAAPKKHPIPEDADPKTALESEGSWMAIHVVEAAVDDKAATASYKLTTTVMLDLASKSSGMGNSSQISGNLTRTSEKSKGFSAPHDHIATIGEMVEQMEGRVRETLREVYCGKTCDVIKQARTPDRPDRGLTGNLMAEMMARNT
jgi:capping protein beta